MEFMTKKIHTPKKFFSKKATFKHKDLIKEQDIPYNTADVSKIYYKEDSICIYNDDILTTNCIAPNSIDLIVTSPPYNVDIQYNSHHDKMTHQDYLQWTKKWLIKCYKFLKNDGRFCLNIPLDKNKGGQQSVCADITTIAKEVGFKYHSTIIWNE
jgi:site-specific DNA-methyltransferase (adenine-specific)